MTRALVDNAADPQQVEGGKRSERMQQQDQDARWKALLGSYDFRAIQWEVLAECGLFKDSYSDNPHRTSRNEGGRKVGLWLLDRIVRVDVESFAKMQQEAAKRDEMMKRPAKKPKKVETPSEGTEETDGDSSD